MAPSYEDHEREYNACLARIRSFLAATRSRSTLTECERLLASAKNSATAMQGLAEVQGDANRIREARQRLERDVAPMTREVQRALAEMTGREELFPSNANNGGGGGGAAGYQAPDIESGGTGDMDALIQSSDELLRESHSILAETEQIGTSTLHQMGRQREQLYATNGHIDAVRGATEQARGIMVNMSRRACRSKMGLYVMIAVLSVANLYVLYRVYKKKHSGGGGGPDDGTNP